MKFIKKNKKKENKSPKKEKWFLKKNRYTLRQLLFCAVIAGVVLTGVYMAKTWCGNYFRAGIHISLVYPEIADGKYPDGKRFSQYDLISEERISEALEKLSAQGIYSDYTVEDIKENLRVYNYLVNPVQAKVEDARSMGEDFTYCSNEYLIYFSQPMKLNFSSLGTVFGLFRPNNSQEFMQALIESNESAITVNHDGDAQAFLTLADVEEVREYDFEETVDLYELKIGQIIDYLNNKKNESNAFVSKTTGMSFGDVITSYEMLRDSDLHQISSFVGSSYLTDNVSMLINKKKTMIEDNNIDYNKALDYLYINNYAMVAYDHTFTENLIVVAANESDGLYQARPKTAYDTVVQQKIEAETKTNEFLVANQQLQRDIDNYSMVVVSEDYTRLCQKADEMIGTFTRKYKEITEKANKTVNDYNLEVNKGYFQVNPVSSGILSADIIKGAIGAFILGAVLGALFSFVRKSLHDRSEEKRKKAIIKSLSD